MANTSNHTDQQQKKCLAEQLWLDYFNATLFKKGLITETQRNRISNIINSRKTQFDTTKNRNYYFQKKN